MSPERSAQYHADNGGIHLSGVPVAQLREQYGLTKADLDAYLPAKPLALAAANVDVRYLGYYIRWKPQEAYYYAVEHGNFECSPERTAGTYSKYNSIDCKADDLHYWTTYVKFGIGRATYDAAQEIRSGDITRDEGVALVKRFDGEFPERFMSELLAYLSVPRLPSCTRESLLELSDKFRSPHLWEDRTLRHRVA